ncbi:YicC/YloC family endoribonuclease [Stella sp.]|uniref:YicC/YloC family endoribonuclease n=1 Tax=Stella sp. TaxID=2912054 RepID=UPI0035B23226
MQIASMTGYARRDGRHGDDAWTWELKSVNGRALEVRTRLPPGCDHLDLPLRNLLAQRLKRGNVSATLTLAGRSGGQRVTINEALLGQVIQAMHDLEGRLDVAPPRLDGLLAIRGILETAEAPPDAAAADERDRILMEDLGRTLDALVAGRAEEGARLLQVLSLRLDEIAGHVAHAQTSAAAQPAAIRDRLLAQIQALLDGANPVGPERLAQEAALLAAKADIREEIDRLHAHIAAARAMLAEGGAVGRRLDFLCQEFNREANTLCSKSGDIGLTRIGLDLKQAIEQFREQIQNIE